MTNDTTVRVPASVLRFSTGNYEAHAHGAAQPTATGRGTTAKEAKAELAASLAWATHVEPGIVRDGEGHPWLAYPTGPAGTWTLRRFSGDSLSSGCAIVGAPNWSALTRIVADWSRPDERECPACLRFVPRAELQGLAGDANSEGWCARCRAEHTCQH